jgi:CHAT domain-containing protein
VGTFWPVNDLAATAIATDFYAGLTHDGANLPDVEHSAHALREAILRLRDRYPALPTRWAARHHHGS